MTYLYSRRASVQEKKNTRKAILYLVLTVVAVIVLVLYGIPFIARTASFVSELKKSDNQLKKTIIFLPSCLKLKLRRNIPIKSGGNQRCYRTGSYRFRHRQRSKGRNRGHQGRPFSYSFNLKKGENIISFTAKDSAGNQSQETKVYTINYDNEPPEISLKSPADGSSFYGSKQQQITIDGEVKDAETLKINDRIVIIENDGSFSYPVTLQEGANNFEVTAEDKAGNKAIARLTVDFWH